MTPLYPDGVYAPLPRFSKKTQTNIAPSATRNTASARCSRDTPIISVAWSSKGSLLFPCFGEALPRYTPWHVHSGSSHRFYALRRRSDISLLDALRDSCGILLDQIERPRCRGAARIQLVRAAAVRSTLCTVDEEAPTREVGDARSKGVWTITAGNAGHGVAFAARGFGVPCTVVAIATAPETKVERMKTRGARI